MNHTDPTAPIRKSSLPTTPPPEWEFYTWFPHPDGGGDMVPGERQRGILVRRRVTYSGWEPVRPDRWADEWESDVAAVPVLVSPPTGHATLRDRIAEALYERERPSRDPKWGDAYAMDRETFEEMADAVLAVLPESGRAATLLDASEQLRRLAAEATAEEEAAAAYSRAFTVPPSDETGAYIGERMKRRLAAEAPQPDTEARPRRGDQFEAWLKQQRDGHGWQGSNDRRLYDAFDSALDDYRLHADTSTPLAEHVCERLGAQGCDCRPLPQTEHVIGSRRLGKPEAPAAPACDGCNPIDCRYACRDAAVSQPAADDGKETR